VITDLLFGADDGQDDGTAPDRGPNRQ